MGRLPLAICGVRAPFHRGLSVCLEGLCCELAEKIEGYHVPQNSSNSDFLESRMWHLFCWSRVRRTRSNAFLVAAQQKSRRSNEALSCQSYKAAISSVFSLTDIDLLSLWPLHIWYCDIIIVGIVLVFGQSYIFERTLAAWHQPSRGWRYEGMSIG